MLYRSGRNWVGNPIVNLVVIALITGGLFWGYQRFISEATPPSATTTPEPALYATFTPNANGSLSPVTTPANNSLSQSQASLDIHPAPNTTIFIPTLGINAPVITAILRDATWDVTELGTNVGYLQGTAWLDDPGGNVVLSGHVEMSDGRTGIFANLFEIGNGDTVILSENGQEYTYIVEETRYVQPSDLSVLYPTGEDILTLITCSDYDFLRDTYDTRLVVIARRV